MLRTLKETETLINQGKLLHISGSEKLLRQLPKGNWLGGSTEYFLARDGGRVTNELLDVREFDYGEFKLASYDITTIPNITRDAYANGFSILILPFDSGVHEEYAKSASGFDGIFLKNIVGWVSGVNLSESGQTPVAVNGRTGEAFPDRAVALHISLPEDKLVLIDTVNIFSPDEDSPVIEFFEDGFTASRCMVDGKEAMFADYIDQTVMNTQLPIIGNYSGAGINISIKSVEDGVVRFYAPVFKGIEYRAAKSIDNYAEAFKARIREMRDAETEFSCNCILNFIYGGLEGEDLGAFYGPVTFGEIAYQLVNQTLVYLRII